MSGWPLPPVSFFFDEAWIFGAAFTEIRLAHNHAARVPFLPMSGMVDCIIRKRACLHAVA